MKRRVFACLIAAGLIASGCAGKGSGSATSTSAPSGASTTADLTKKFGTLDNPCGKVDKPVTIKATDAGKKADKFYIGVANDRTFSVAPGLLKEMFDTSQAFADWCNAAGGLAGIPIEIVDLDAQFTNVEQAMGTACSSTFALVGGGWAQDDKMFSGKDGSDFTKCKMIAVPSFAVSPAVTEGDRIVQPVPNPAYQRSSAWLEDIAKLYPDKTKKLVVAYGAGSASLKANEEQIYAVAKKIPGSPWGVGDPIAYNPLTPDMPAAARQIVQEGATAVSFVGEAGFLAQFAAALKDQNYTGLIFADANMYDPLVIKSSTGKTTEGIIARTVIHPFEEADKWPAMKEFLSIMAQYNKGKSDTPLAVQSFSSWLLFGQSVKKCAASGEVTRDCVYNAAKSVTSWDGGGLHATGNPS